MRLYYDLHLHSCLSPCADEDMTPANLAAMCALAGLDVVALTDHNTTGNCASFLRACRSRGLLALPGMELTTAEEVHILCLLPDLGAAAALQALTAERQRRVDNDLRIFGRQLYMDAGDTVLGEEPRLLLSATDLRIEEVLPLVAALGGAAFPAHIDRSSFSLLSNLGLWDPGLGFPLAEVSRQCPADFAASRPDLADVPLISGSDAHRLEEVGDRLSWMELPEKTAAAVLAWLRRGGPGVL